MENTKRRNTFLWVLGWLFMFPLPLTILLLRKHDMKPAVKYGIITAAWVVYLLIGIGYTSSRGDDETATEPVSREIAAEPVSTEEEPEVRVMIPSAQEEPPEILEPDEPVIPEEPETQADDGTRVMKLRVTHPRVDDVNIGDDWNYVLLLNGERVGKEYRLAVGDTLICDATFTEQDSNPDVGHASTTHTVTEEELENGFEISMDLYVTEGSGKNSGKSARFIVTYRFEG